MVLYFGVRLADQDDTRGLRPLRQFGDFIHHNLHIMVVEVADRALTVESIAWMFGK